MPQLSELSQSNGTIPTFYPYSPSHVAPAVFAALIGLSFILHIYQNFRYRFWRVTFFMIWGGAVFTTGWVARTIASFDVGNANLYIVQTVFILAGPPIYSAAEYNILGRLLNYVPMHSPLHPDRLYYFFINVGVVVESLTAAGAAMKASAGRDNPNAQLTGGKLLSISLVLQAALEVAFVSIVMIVHRRCAKAKQLPRNIKTLFTMLYCTSFLVFVRCVARGVESFSTDTSFTCNSTCRVIYYHEWYLYVFEAAPMLLYTVWLNIIHPGRFIPSNKTQYLDFDGETERMGPGWIDRRSKVATFLDPFDLEGLIKGKPAHEKFWMKAQEWKVAHGGSFAMGTASNVGKEQYEGVSPKGLCFRRNQDTA